MKTKIFFLLFAAGLIVSAVAWAKNEPTETICHKGKTLKVLKSSVAAHLAHGDTLGACGS